MSKRFESWMLGLAAIAISSSAFCPVAAAQAKSPQGKAAPAKAAVENAPAAETPLLTIGSKAPALDIEHWISDGNGKFKPVTKFAPGRVYVIEFWATWCGPCIASMPHLAEMQAKYAKQGVQIISISDEDLETIQAFLKTPVRSAQPDADADAKDSKKEKAEKAPKQTYAQLTSTYCLTTDPDASVGTDYMEAAAQNGIPTSFIVGKTGQVEWIGHPMSLDEPLEQIVADKWDRAAFLVKFKKEQDHDSLMAKLGTKMRKGDTKGALTILAEAKKTADGDAATIKMLEKLEFQVRVTPVFAKIEEGDLKQGMAELDEIISTATPEQKSELTMIKFKLLVESEEFDAAAKALIAVADDKNVDADSINELTWQIYEAAKDDAEFSPILVDAAAKATEKGLAKAPKNGMIMDTLAHFLHYQGKLDRAIELQTQAIENAGDLSDEGKAEMAAFLKSLKKEKGGK